MKKLLLFLLLSCSIMSLQAQVVENRKMKIETLGSFESRNGKGHYWNIEGNSIFLLYSLSCNGVWEYKFNDWFKLGAGAGLTTGLLYVMLSSSWAGINGFGRIGFDIPTRRNVSPFITMDFGSTVAFGMWGVHLYYFFQPTIGIAINKRYKEGKLLIGLTGNMLGSEDEITNFPLPGLKIGYTF